MRWITIYNPNECNWAQGYYFKSAYFELPPHKARHRLF